MSGSTVLQVVTLVVAVLAVLVSATSIAVTVREQRGSWRREKRYQVYLDFIEASSEVLRYLNEDVVKAIGKENIAHEHLQGFRDRQLRLQTIHWQVLIIANESTTTATIDWLHWVNDGLPTWPTPAQPTLEQAQLAAWMRSLGEGGNLFMACVNPIRAHLGTDEKGSLPLGPGRQTANRYPSA